MERIISSRAVEVASHLSGGDVIDGPEVPAPLNAADPIRNPRRISITVEGTIVPDVPWVSGDVNRVK